MNNKIHSIRYPFAIDKGFGKLAEETDYDRHVVQMIKQVLFTNPGERINRPDFGCGIRRMVFAPNSDVSANLSQVIIHQSLEKWMGTIIELNDVKVNNIEETLEIKIVYLVRATQQRRYLNLDVTL
ncbi:MAG: GPW/gp25 family protein [Ignavibacteria bacterium]|nr:GPW/gp25 family protein [Ignavibacteria bacterium]